MSSREMNPSRGRHLQYVGTSWSRRHEAKCRCVSRRRRSPGATPRRQPNDRRPLPSSPAVWWLSRLSCHCHNIGVCRPGLHEGCTRKTRRERLCRTSPPVLRKPWHPHWTTCAATTKPRSYTFGIGDQCHDLYKSSCRPCRTDPLCACPPWYCAPPHHRRHGPSPTCTQPDRLAFRTQH